MLIIINYGLGNVQAFVNIYKRLNIECVVASSAAELAPATSLILPGVGSFDWAMTCLNGSGMRPCLDQLVIEKKCPILGICVGMQMMAHTSEEGELEGLGWIDAAVKRFSNPDLQLPHMGWNDVAPQNGGRLFQGLEREARFYFLHSYYIEPQRAENVLAVTEYGGTFASSVCSGNVYGVQFHPEKSHQWGIKLLKNFAEIK